MPTTETPPEQHTADTALYTEWDVARHLHIPVWGVHAMLGRGRPHPKWFFERQWREMSHDERPRLPFRRLTELYIRSAVIHAATDAWESEHPARGSFGHWEDLWWFLDGNPAGGETGDPLWVDEYAGRAAARLPGVNGERIRKFVLMYADRVEVVEGSPVRLFPFSRGPSSTAPRFVVLNPRVRFGSPTLVGRGVPTEVIIDRFRGGDSAAFMAEDYDTPVEEIEEAIRYETRASSLSHFPFTGW